MIRNILIFAIVLIGLIISGCTETDVQNVDNTTDMPDNVSNTTTMSNNSEQADNQSMMIPLQKPPFIE